MFKSIVSKIFMYKKFESHVNVNIIVYRAYI